MLTCYRSAAWILGPIILWAAFSSEALSAVDRPLVSLESGMNDLVYRLSRSVVTVQNVRQTESPLSANSDRETVEHLTASGIVCDTLGHILTSAGMVQHHDDLFVSFENRRVPAKLIAIDYFHDLALLKVATPLGRPPGLSDRRVCAGQMVVAMGHAYGLRASPVIGFCAGVRPDGTLQFGVSVSPSSVGGGVFDLAGNLLGIISATMGPMTGVAVAVPAYQVPATVKHLTTQGDRLAGYIGISTADIEITPGIELKPSEAFSSADRAYGGVIDRGVIVTYLAPSSPALQAGLRKGDIIVGYLGSQINSALDLARLVRQTKPGAIAEVDFIRSNRQLTTRVKVGRKSLSTHFSETNHFEETEPPSADSLASLLNYLKQEVSRLESRLKRAR